VLAVLLVLAGLGLSAGHITLGLLEYLDRARKIYLDAYTMPVDASLAELLERRYGGKLVVSRRRDLEEGYLRILEEAREGVVVVLVPGDPLVATTHISLVVEARRRGIKARVLPGISGVLASMTSTGLSYYKFGKTATIPGPWRGVEPYSTLETIYSNMCTGAHTLLLLDIDDGGNQLDPVQGLETLLGLEERVELRVLSEAESLIVWDAGTEDERVVKYKRGRAPSYRGRIASIVVPGNVNRIEAEHVETLHGISLDPGLYRVLGEKACGAWRSLGSAASV
jgi:diphthine synthase